MKAIGFAEHGNIFNWIYKKQNCEENKLKYIHGQEFYITESLEEKMRDNYHTILIARNWEGVKELNKLSSIAYHKNDGHFYYDPRISIDELINTSDNIIITTACLASPLYKGFDKPIFKKYLKFLIENKHRCFLEVQYHVAEQQKQYNNFLYELHKKYNIPLIAGTDTHTLNKDLSETRKILLQSKRIQYSDEDSFDLSFKTYDELINEFKKQNILSENVFMQAIENTNLLADTIEDFQLDKTNKYPRLYDNAEEIFKEKINKGTISRGFNKFEKEKRNKYFERIKEEFEVYKKCDAIDYMLLQEDIITWARNKEIYPGPGRGSVTGSEIAYVLGITDIDSIKFNTNFFRFINPDRISLADIDVDFPHSKRNEVIDYVASIPGIYFSEIVTFNTVADRGAIREVGRALEMPLDVIDNIAKNLENEEDTFRKQYPKLFKYVDLLKGTNVSVGSHPSGFLVSPIPIDENIGYFYTSESKYPVSQCNMKEVDSVNFVKLDILGLDNMDIINETCKLANIERLTPDNVNFEDDEVWEEIKQSSLGIFQFEGKFAHDTLIKVLNLVDNIRKRQPDVQRLELMSMTNGAIRPSGESFREDLCNGIVRDNGHEALNEFLSPTMGYLVYQEQIMMFLVKFCGFSMSEADNVRRLIGKKLGTEDVIGEIKERFIKTMHEVYNVPNEQLKKIVEPFIKIIEDASSYGFSVNHSTPYSAIGYICGYLRKYYPLEFTNIILNINEDNIEKTNNIVKYAQSKNIKIKPIKFRKSKDKYTMSKEENAIYKGIKSIKYLNSQIAEELYELGKNQYNSFLDLLIDIKEKTSVNSRQLDILIKLSFFNEFGNNKKLLDFVQLFNQYYNKKQLKKDKIHPKYEEIIKSLSRETAKSYMDFQSYEFLQQIWKQIPNEKLSVVDELQTQKEFLGYCETKISNLNHPIFYVFEINTKYTPKLFCYSLQEGKEYQFKIYKKLFKKEPLQEGNLIYIQEKILKPKKKLVDGNWVDLEEKEWIINSYYKVAPEKLENHLKQIKINA